MPKYTGDIDKDLKVLIPEIIIDSVTDDAEERKYLAERLRHIYRNAEFFGRRISRESAKSRDILKAFLEHWLESGRRSGAITRI